MPRLAPCLPLAALLALALGACTADRAARRPDASASSAAAEAPPTVTPLASGTTSLLIGLDAADGGRSVWASGAAGTFARSLDGGRTWTAGRVPGADTLQFRDVEAFSATEAVLLAIGNGAASRIVRTTDGGATWTTAWVNPDAAAFYDCLAFHDRRRGFAFSDAVAGAAGPAMPVVETRDGGATWRPARALPAAEGEGAFASSGTCALAAGDRAWIVTNGGTNAGQADRIVRTTDGGATWTATDAPFGSSDGARGLATLARARGLMLAGSLGEIDGETMLRSTDDGRTWQRSPRTTIGEVYGVALALDGRRAVAVGPDGLDASADGGLTWTHLSDTVYWTAVALPGGAFLVAGRGGALARVW